MEKVLNMADGFDDSLSHALDVLPFGADIVDENCNILFLNAKLRARFGSNFAGRKCWELYKDDKKKCENCPLKKGIEIGKTSVIETDSVLGSKSFSVTHTGLVYKGQNACLEVFHDITEHKAIEAQLRRQLAALEAAANSIIITDRDGCIIWTNPAFTRLTGYSAEEVLGKKPLLLKSGMHESAFYKNLWDTILAGKVWQGEIINRRKDGSLYYEDMTITPLYEEDEIVNFIAIKQDISERKMAEEKLRIFNEELVRFNQVMVGRELRMIELKKEVNELCLQAGLPQRYLLDFEVDEQTKQKRGAK